MGKVARIVMDYYFGKDTQSDSVVYENKVG